MKGPTVHLSNVSRSFGPIAAVSDADVTFSPGEIHAVIGENGAGKSTLLKMAAGLFPPTKGEVHVDGSAVRFADPGEAIRRGIGMVHQHFMLVGAFTALENVVLGHERVQRSPLSWLGVLDLGAARTEVIGWMRRTGLSVPLDAPASQLSVGDQQRLEILRVLYRGARAILLDEPTAVLTPIEAKDLYRVLRALAEDGTTIVVVTHRLDEVVAFADRVTVMRRGRVVLSEALTAEGRDAERLTRAIMGRDAPPAFELPIFDPAAEEALALRAVTFKDPSGRTVLDRVDLSVKRGEIVGVAGVEGNGQRELVAAIAGLLEGATGAIHIAGRRFGAGARGAEDVLARRAVLSVVHEDRHAEGLMLDASVADNLVLGDLDRLRSAAEERDVVRRRIEGFGVSPPDAALLASALSGGNQQKIVVARALDRLADRARSDASKGAALRGAAVLAQPTRGVDVGAAAAIHEAIGRSAERGMGALVVSADLAELRKLCHRLVVMRKGKIVADLSPDTPEDVIGRHMLGATDGAKGADKNPEKKPENEVKS